MFLRAKCDRAGSAGVDFGCESVGRFSLKPAMDLRRFAASARDAKSVSWSSWFSDGDTACVHCLMCACATATCSNLVERLRRPRASHVAHRASSIKVLVRLTRLRRGHWAMIVSNGRGGLTDVIRRAIYARPSALAARQIQDGFSRTTEPIDTRTK